MSESVPLANEIMQSVAFRRELFLCQQELVARHEAMLAADPEQYQRDAAAAMEAVQIHRAVVAGHMHLLPKELLRPLRNEPMEALLERQYEHLKAYVDPATQATWTRAIDRARTDQSSAADGGSFATRVMKYLQVEALHARRGPASSDTVATRTAACRACEHRVAELDGLKDPGEVGFCTKCGCGGAKRAALSVKLTLAGATCPVGKWAATQGVGGSAATVTEAASGLMSSVAHHAKRLFARKDITQVRK